MSNQQQTGDDAMTYTYHINLDERGEFFADVHNEREQTVFEIHGGEIFEDGFMRHKTDVESLREYLDALNILDDADKIILAH